MGSIYFDGEMQSEIKQVLGTGLTGLPFPANQFQWTTLFLSEILPDGNPNAVDTCSSNSGLADYAPSCSDQTGTSIPVFVVSKWHFSEQWAPACPELVTTDVVHTQEQLLGWRKNLTPKC